MINKLILSLTFFGLLVSPAVFAQGPPEDRELPPRGNDQAETDAPADEANIQIESVKEEGQMRGNDSKLDFEVTEGEPPVEGDEETDSPGRGQGQGRGYLGMEAINEQASQVAQRVQELLNDPEFEGEGFGQQVREVAMEQNQAQEQVREHVQAIESRGQIMRLFLGSDQQAVSGLENQLRQNRDRLARLEELANQAPTEEIQVKIQNAQTALQEQDDVLGEAIEAERQVRGILGPLFSLFGF